MVAKIERLADPMLFSLPWLTKLSSFANYSGGYKTVPD